MARVKIGLGRSPRLCGSCGRGSTISRVATGGSRTELAADGQGAAVGWAEAPQGELVTWVEIRDGLIHRVHIASPSLRNWALFDNAFPKDVLTDFAFIEHSFGLTPAGADR